MNFVIKAYLIHGVKDVVLRGWIHEMKLQQVLNAQRLQQQYDVGLNKVFKNFDIMTVDYRNKNVRVA